MKYYFTLFFILISMSAFALNFTFEIESANANDEFQIISSNGDINTTVNAASTSFTTSAATIDVTYLSSSISATKKFTIQETGYMETLNKGQVTTLPQGVLPVDLSYFYGKQIDDFIVIKFGTESETNNDKFNLERIAQGEDWAVIGEVKGHGTSVINKDYRIADLNPNLGVNYYRLKQIDFNGSYEYSDVISIDFKQEIQGRNQIVSDRVTFKGQGFLISPLGQIVKKGEDGMNVSNTPNGTYYLKTNEGINTVIVSH